MRRQRELARWADRRTASVTGRTLVVPCGRCANGGHLRPAFQVEVGWGGVTFVRPGRTSLHNEGHGAHYQQCQNPEHLLSHPLPFGRCNMRHALSVVR